MKYADLHIHTNFSDGSMSPQDVLQAAYDNGIDCIAISDHDTIMGIPVAVQHAKKYGIEVIPGIELSTEINGKDVHILGYLFDYNNTSLIEKLNQMQNVRIDRMRKMIDKLKELGIDGIELDEVCALAESDSVGRPHLAMVLKKKGIVPDIKKAFERYIGDGGPAYVPKYKQTPIEAIKLIKSVGGVAVLAHPMLTNVDELIPQFVKAGLVGIEAYYPNCSEKVIDFYKRIAAKHGLVVTGGSDAHGETTMHAPIGKIKIPYELVEQLKQAKQNLAVVDR